MCFKLGSVVMKSQTETFIISVRWERFVHVNLDKKIVYRSSY